jgi:hypothetical protein
MSRSGQITITTAGTAVQGTSVNGDMFALAAHPDNTDVVWVGSDGAGDVSSSNGFPLSAGKSIAVIRVGSLDELWFDADVNGEKVCWLVL